MGGLSRRAHILKKIRNEETKPVLAIDAGAMLFPQPSVAPSLYSAKTVQAGGLIEAMAKMGYDAVGLAPMDLPAGAEFLLKQPPGSQLPWLSLNLTGIEGSEPLFTPSIVKTIGDISVAIVGLTGHTQDGQETAAYADYRINSWKDRLEREIAGLRDQADMVILLSSLPEQTNREIAEQYHDINLIIQAGQTTANRRPQLHGNALITQVGSRGKYLGRLDIDWTPSRSWEQSVLSTIKPVRDRLDRVNWQIGRMEKRYPGGEAEKNPQYLQLQQEKNRLTAEVEQMESLRQAALENLSTYRSEFISLSVSLPEDPEIREIVHRTKLAVNRSHQQALAQGKQAGPGAGRDPFNAMAGWKTCRTCHQPQTDFWQKTGHAGAWETLVKAEQQFNRECLLCHVTLPTYDQETVIRQNLLAGLKEEFRGVGCETCHGPARQHSLQPAQFLPANPDEQLCLSCHTPERDDNFVYEEKLKKIRCPAAGH